MTGSETAYKTHDGFESGEYRTTVVRTEFSSDSRPAKPKWLVGLVANFNFEVTSTEVLDAKYADVTMDGPPKFELAVSAGSAIGELDVNLLYYHWPPVGSDTVSASSVVRAMLPSDLKFFTLKGSSNLVVGSKFRVCLL